MSEQPYEEMLMRAREQLPEKVFEDIRFEPPTPQSNIEGNRSIISNWNELAARIERESPHLLKFFSNELGTSGHVDGLRAIFQGKHRNTTIIQIYKKYLDYFIYCPECSKPDTRLVTKDRVLRMRCDACGAMSAVRSV
jgi:translation initiation factor 2 subunit 2